MPFGAIPNGSNVMLKDVKDLGLSAEIVRLEMAKSPIEFHLTGSRRFGSKDSTHSDWNFFAAYSDVAVESLKSLGFVKNGRYAQSSTMEIHGAGSYVKYVFQQAVVPTPDQRIEVFLLDDPQKVHTMVDACQYLDGRKDLQDLAQQKATKVNRIIWSLLMSMVSSDQLAQQMIVQRDKASKRTSDLRDQVYTLEGKVEAKSASISEKLNQILSLETEVTNLKRELEAAKGDAAKVTRIDDLLLQVEKNRDYWVDRYDAMLTEKIDTARALKERELEICELDSKIKSLEEDQADAFDEIGDLTKLVRDLEGCNGKLISATLERDQLQVERDQLLKTLDTMEERIQGEKHATDCALDANAALIRDASTHQAELEAAKVRTDCLEIQLKDAEQEQSDLRSSLVTETGARQDLTNKVFKVRLAAIIGHVIVGATSAYYPEVWAFICKYGQPICDYVYVALNGAPIY